MTLPSVLLYLSSEFDAISTHFLSIKDLNFCLDSNPNSCFNSGASIPVKRTFLFLEPSKTIIVSPSIILTTKPEKSAETGAKKINKKIKNGNLS